MLLKMYHLEIFMAYFYSLVNFKFLFIKLPSMPKEKLSNIKPRLLFSPNMKAVLFQKNDSKKHDKAPIDKIIKIALGKVN